MLLAMLSLFASLVLAEQKDIAFQSLSFNTSADTLPDFSFAGYLNSNTPLPDPHRPATIRLYANTSSGDRTKDIQQAVNQAAKAGGGIVELDVGTYILSSGTIHLSGSNVTIRGIIPAKAGQQLATALVVSGEPRYIFTIGRPDVTVNDLTTLCSSDIIEDYVPVGRSYVAVADVSQFKVGQDIRITRQVSKSWIAALHMDQLVRDGRPQTWLSPGTESSQYRTISAIAGNTVVFDNPLTDSINASFAAKGQVVAYTLPKGMTSQVGLEYISIQPVSSQSGWPIDSTGALEGVAAFSPFVKDSWVRSINSTGFLSSYIVERAAKQITLQDLMMTRDHSADGAAGYPADIMLQGTSTLVLRCATRGVRGSHSFSVTTGSLTHGPNAIVQYSSVRGDHQIQPHQRWATGLLLDNSNIGSAQFINRQTLGTGQGWAIGNSVMWNVRARGEVKIQSPPYSANLCVGCISDDFSTASTETSFIAKLQQITPASLFESQLALRRGKDAVYEILGYAASVVDNPTASGLPIFNALPTKAPVEFQPIANSKPTTTQSTAGANSTTKAKDAIKAFRPIKAVHPRIHRRKIH